jgi:hypothetical protein
MDTIGQNESANLLARLDAWKPGDHDTGPLIRWAAAHLRGELALSLDAAWTEAVAAIDHLNAGIVAGDPLLWWGGPKVYRYTGDELCPYGAMASPPGDTGSDGIYGYGPTPAAALRALTTRLHNG